MEDTVDRVLGERQYLVGTRKRDRSGSLGPSEGLSVTAGVVHSANIVDSPPETTITAESGPVNDEAIDDFVVVAHEDVEVIGRKELNKKVEVKGDGHVGLRGRAEVREATSMTSGWKKCQSAVQF